MQQEVRKFTKDSYLCHNDKNTVYGAVSWALLLIGKLCHDSMAYHLY